MTWSPTVEVQTTALSTPFKPSEPEASTTSTSLENGGMYGVDTVHHVHGEQILLLIRPLYLIFFPGDARTESGGMHLRTSM